MFSFLCLSRLGLWVLDISIQELPQICVPADSLASFAGTIMSFVALFELCHWVLVAAVSRPEQCGWLGVVQLQSGWRQGCIAFGLWDEGLERQGEGRKGGWRVRVRSWAEEADARVKERNWLFQVFWPSLYMCGCSCYTEYKEARHLWLAQFSPFLSHIFPRLSHIWNRTRSAYWLHNRILRINTIALTP